MPVQAYLKALATSQYRGTIVDGPGVVASPAALRRLVAQTPGGLGFLPLEEVDPSVAVVSIDGHGPDQRGYVLRVE